MEQMSTNSKPQRSLFGKIIKWTFIGYNVLMLFWFISGLNVASDGITNSASDAEKAGATIGSGIGIMLIIFVWTAGTVILGIFTLLTRAKS